MNISKEIRKSFRIEVITFVSLEQLFTLNSMYCTFLKLHSIITELTTVFLRLRAEDVVAGAAATIPSHPSGTHTFFCSKYTEFLSARLAESETSCVEITSSHSDAIVI